eukprot:TRINITY_DN220_c0_g2_i2.p1 TRINITY_DN220_c0_g2~~TRINITY_DN220_c0_g2_i2.p1  ORF type:complete len:370 (-),score=60.81 TRINITY_DN220_c0_g2_i2:211-1248(-)
MSFSVTSSVKAQSLLRRPTRQNCLVNCHAKNVKNAVCEIDRREAFMGSVMAVTAPQLISGAPAWAQGELSVKNLSYLQKNDQKLQILKNAQEVLGNVLTGADASKCMLLLFNDAATFDIASKTGGVDGSIQFELDRPENATLKPLVEKLLKAKSDIDELNAQFQSGPISFADLICIAARFATKKSWFNIKLARAKNSTGGEIVASAFASEFPLDLGRVDATVANSSSKVPQTSASPSEVREFLFNLGRKEGEGEGFFSKKPPFWERPGFVIYTATRDDPAAAEQEFANYDQVYADLKLSYDRSRKTITRTDYEVDFANYFNRLANLGTKFDPDAYLHPIKTVFKY